MSALVSVAPTGIRAWLAPKPVARRPYEAPVCERDRSRVYADTITVFQVRHVLARMIDPKHIASGWMPRRVYVTNESGSVMREMTAEQLGAKLIARGAVEFAVNGQALPSTVCPGCGMRKGRRAKACVACAGRAPCPEARVCACGMKKYERSKVCMACIRASAPPRFCSCGTRLKGTKTRQCIRCLNATRDLASGKRCACGSTKKKESKTCRDCSTNAPRPEKTVCGCGRKKASTSATCRGCWVRSREWKPSDSVRCAAEAMFAHGASLRAIAKATGVERSKVKRYLCKARRNTPNDQTQRAAPAHP